MMPDMAPPYDTAHGSRPQRQQNPVIPAYRVSEGTAPRLAFWCPWCECAHRHGDTGGLIEPRGSDPCDPPHCPFTGYRLLVLGRVRHINALPRMSRDHMRAAIDHLTAALPE